MPHLLRFWELNGYFFHCGRLSSAQLDRWQAQKQRPIIDPHPVEQTAYRRDIKDNGYKSVVDEGIRQKSTKEWTHSLTAVPFVRGHWTVSPRTQRNTCVYTRHPASCHGHVWRVDTAPGKTRTKTECVLRRPPIGGWKKNCGFKRHPMRTG